MCLPSKDKPDPNQQSKFKKGGIAKKGKQFRPNGGEVFGNKNTTDVISNNDSNSSGGD